MSLIKLALRRETLGATFALLFAMVATLGLVAARVAWTGKSQYGFLAWNLFLAWLPLVFSLVAWHLFEAGRGWNWKLAACGALWLLFFPNAPYICTDLIHLTRGFYRSFWVDMVLIITCAFMGLVLGFMSLYIMQNLVRQLAGSLASWVFIAMVAGLSGFGVYIGRFLRFNSWDILVRPWTLLDVVRGWLANPSAHPSHYFPLLFAVFLFITYLMLYALTQMQHLAPRLALESGTRSAA